VNVPTVERGFFPTDFCSIDMAGRALDHVDVGLLPLFEELAALGGERLHVPPLPLGVDRAKASDDFRSPRPL